MLRFSIPLITACLLFSISFSTSTQTSASHYNTVNTILGDVSFVEKFEVEPGDLSSEEIRIKTHLEYVIIRLKEADRSGLKDEQKSNRAHLIDLLEDYKEAGQFPQNHHFENRRPVFIDRDGNLCAVGYLIAKTEGLEAAQKINQNHKFDYIKDIDPMLIDVWLANNGITKKEAAMIQPSYDFIEPEPKRETITRNNIETEYAIGSSILAGAQIGISTFMLLNRSNVGGKRAHLFNAALGATSFTLGLINLDNSKSQTQTICGTVPPCWEQEIVIKNQSRTNLSIANVILGGAFATLNTYQFFKARDQEESSNFKVSATQLFDPVSDQTAPALSLTMKF